MPFPITDVANRQGKATWASTCQVCTCCSTQRNGVGLNRNRSHLERHAHCTRTVGGAAFDSKQISVGARIVAVDRKGVSERSLEQVKPLIIGPEGTLVKIMPERGGAAASDTEDHSRPALPRAGAAQRASKRGREEDEGEGDGEGARERNSLRVPTGPLRRQIPGQLDPRNEPRSEIYIRVGQLVWTCAIHRNELLDTDLPCNIRVHAAGAALQVPCCRLVLPCFNADSSPAFFALPFSILHSLCPSLPLSLTPSPAHACCRIDLTL
eukprot:1973558-Rhodomonas_salina.1